MEREILLKRLLNASLGEERTELILDMCYLHGLEIEEGKEARQKRLKEMWMGHPVYIWDLDVGRRRQKLEFDGKEYHEFIYNRGWSSLYWFVFTGPLQ